MQNLGMHAVQGKQFKIWSSVEGVGRVCAFQRKTGHISYFLFKVSAY